MPPVSAFDSVMMSGVTPAASQANSAAGAAEAGENLVEDQQQLVAVGGRAQALQHRRLVEQHAARALHQRLDDDAGDLVRACGSSSAIERRRALVVARQRRR